jgi:hypothetical protein
MAVSYITAIIKLAMSLISSTSASTAALDCRLLMLL